MAKLSRQQLERSETRARRASIAGVSYLALGPPSDAVASEVRKGVQSPKAHRRPPPPPRPATPAPSKENELKPTFSGTDTETDSDDKVRRTDVPAGPVQCLDKEGEFDPYQRPVFRTILNRNHIDVWDLQEGGHALIKGRALLTGIRCSTREGRQVPFSNLVVIIRTRAYSNRKTRDTPENPEFLDLAIEHVKVPNSLVRIRKRKIKGAGGIQWGYTIAFSCRVPEKLFRTKRSRGFLIAVSALFGNHSVDDPMAAEMEIRCAPVECTISQLLTRTDMLVPDAPKEVIRAVEAGLLQKS